MAEELRKGGGGVKAYIINQMCGYWLLFNRAFAARADA